MWRASTDDKFVLKEEFKDLLCTALEEPIIELKILAGEDPAFLKSVFNETEEDPEFVFGTITWHQPFERLANRDKIILFARTLRALTCPTTPAPELTQNNESAVYAMFEALEAAIEVEVDTAKEAQQDGFDPYIIRRLAAAVERKYCKYEDAADYIDYTSKNLDGWHDMVDRLSDIILWDLDFIENEDGTALGNLADQDPAIAGMIKKQLGIDPDYYSHAIEAVTYDEFIADTNYLFDTVLN